MNINQKKLSEGDAGSLLNILKTRFEQNVRRHPNLSWEVILNQLLKHPEKLISLNEMERTGGEPDVICFDSSENEYAFYDCCIESPKGRRSLCYDREALDARKEHPPENNAIEMAQNMGVTLLSEQQYRQLQSMFNFDLKTSSWVLTPENIRKQGGAIFCDYRYGQVFTYHNGAQSYYASRGFRSMLSL